MIWPVAEVLVALLLIAIAFVVVVALAVAAMLGLLAFRVVRKAHWLVGWIRWPEQKKGSAPKETGKGK